MTWKKYLLILDDTPIAPDFHDYFAKFGFEIEHKTSLKSLDLKLNPSAAILVNSTVLHTGVITIEKLYRQYHVPIIVISDAADEELCIQMLEAGADDFIVKPIHPRELHARISAINRRVQHATQNSDHDKEVLLFGNCRLYPSSRQLFNENHELPLSPKEYDLLLAFVRHPLHTLSRDFLLQTSKSSDIRTLDRRIDVQISRLRQKIETDAKRPLLIKTVRNGGYVFTAQVSSTRGS